MARLSLAPALLVVCLAATSAAAQETDPTDFQPWDGWHAWPIVGHDTWSAPSGKVVRDRWSVVWPLFQFWHDPIQEERGFTAPWPLVEGVWGPEYSHARLLPLFGYWRFSQERVFFLGPLAVAAWRPGAWTTLAPLFYGQKDPETLRLVLFPVAWWMDEPSGGLRSIWPLFHYRWRDSEEGHSRLHLDLLPATLLPVGAWRADAEKDDAYVGLLWPLLFGYRAKGEAWSMRFLFEGVVVWSDGGDHIGWRILGGLFSYESRGAAFMRWSIFWGVFTREIVDKTAPG